MAVAAAVFDIDGVVRDVGGSYRRALADTVEQFTQRLGTAPYRPSAADVDRLKGEGLWNNDWKASQELIYRHLEQQGRARSPRCFSYDDLVAYFQARYRGNPGKWDGYITNEPLLITQAYLASLTQNEIAWGFFSGAMRDEALYVLRRLGLAQPPLVAMEDAPDKPDPTGLMQVVQQISSEPIPVVYVGDTVADMETVNRACAQFPQRRWIGVGILPPHVWGDEQGDGGDRDRYVQTLIQAGAARVLRSVTALDPPLIRSLVHSQGQSPP